MKSKSNPTGNTIFGTVKVLPDNTRTVVAQSNSYSRGGAICMEEAQKAKREGHFVEGRAAKGGYAVYDKKGGELLYRLEYLQWSAVPPTPPTEEPTPEPTPSEGTEALQELPIPEAPATEPTKAPSRKKGKVLQPATA